MNYIKYIQKEHFNGLIESGSVRVGTLKDYQDGEYGEMVADSMEGVKRFSGSYSSVTSESIKSSKAMSSLIGISEGASVEGLEINNYTVAEPDFYIFSFAQGHSIKDHEVWLKEEGYDVAYSIDFPTTFFRKITQQLNRITPVQFLGLFEVHYYDEKNGMDFFDPLNGHPAFCLKDYDGFSTQKEMRAVWEPLNDGEIKPINLNVEGLGRYVDLKMIIPRLNMISRYFRYPDQIKIG
ncbi:hypothetical protein BCU25_016460 [Vibrio cyclitrophicus]|nr:hypothetical protein [Vibrio cyclitrophicus]PMJ34123.1 hypothetical protein BCU25_09370 [Vibrio cyclitrophicus]